MQRTWLVVLAFMASAVFASPEKFSNPVIAGFAPDPSIVRVGDDFYLVNSTFEYFPGIPVYHSRDLVNWTLISYALHDRTQVDLDRVSSGSGIHASTIRYHDGTFYVVTTNNRDGELVNFVVTASDPRGPWSEAHVLEGAPGIDPSLFFDDDGRAWYVGNHAPPDPAFSGEMEIWLQEVDIEIWRLVGERHFLWRGCCGGAWAEGPHIYKRDGHYYLLISEGGTSFEHAMSVAISRDITGPYENNPRNPILTHRHLSYDFPISGVGHADFVELADGRWYVVALGWRLVDGEHGILGRETFLVPMTWETEPHRWKKPRYTFPVVSPDTGRIELRFDMPFENSVQHGARDFADEFDDETLQLEWNVRRTHDVTFHSLTERPGWLRLRLQPGRIGDRDRYSFVGIRQRQFEFEAETSMRFVPQADGEEAGLTVIQNDRSALVMTLHRSDGSNFVQLYRVFDGERTQLASVAWDQPAVRLKVVGNYLDFSFLYAGDDGAWRMLADRVDGTQLSPALISGFNYTGLYVGPYASSNGAASDTVTDYEYFRYRNDEASRDAWFHR